MFRLFTTSYPEPSSQRAAEYELCLRKNVENRSFDAIHIIAESGVAPRVISDKIVVKPARSRPTYDDFLRWINEIASDADVSVIANSDIWFDDSILTAAAALEPGQCFALARWDGESLFDRNDSQDCWIWRGKVKTVLADFPLGVPRCDNRFMYELQRAGYEVLNPAFSIKAHHVHAGARGEYADRNLTHFVEPPYGYLYPHNLWSLPRTLLHNLCDRGHPLGWRFDRRRLAATLPMRAAAKVLRAVSPRREAA